MDIRQTYLDKYKKLHYENPDCCFCKKTIYKDNTFDFSYNSKRKVFTFWHSACYQVAQNNIKLRG